VSWRASSSPNLILAGGGLLCLDRTARQTGSIKAAPTEKMGLLWEHAFV
jgi:hypothetical protein